MGERDTVFIAFLILYLILFLWVQSTLWVVFKKVGLPKPLPISLGFGIETVRDSVGGSVGTIFLSS